MPLSDAISVVFSSNIYWILIGAITALGILRGVWKGLFKKKKCGSDYLISLIIYIVTDGFIAFLFGCILCVLLQYLPAFIGLNIDYLNQILK